MIERHHLGLCLILSSAVVAAGLAGCKGAGPTGEGNDAESVHHGRMSVAQPMRTSDATARLNAIPPESRIALTPVESFLLQKEGSPHFEVSWFGPEPAGGGAGDAPRGYWEEEADGPGWFVVSGYVYAFGWWPYLFTEFTTAGTVGAENCTGGTLYVATQIVSGTVTRHILLGRSPHDQTGPCAPDNYYINVSVKNTNMSQILKSVDHYVEYDDATQTLSPALAVSSNPDVQDFVNWLNETAAAVGKQAPPPLEAP